MQLPSITAGYLAVLALLYTALAIRVVRLRVRNGTFFGDEGNAGLRSAIRAHGHFAEYVPIIALMAAMLEMSGLPAQGAIRLPWGGENTVLPLVSGEDVARVAAGLLTSAQLKPGTPYPLIGATLSLKEIIATFGRVLGRDVRYQEISDEEWRSEAASRGYNQHAVEHLSALWRAIRSAAIDPADPRYAVTDTIERIGGRKPKPFEAFVRERQRDLMPQAA